MKDTIRVIAMIIVIVGVFAAVVALILGPARLNAGLEGTYSAELLMPGNTLVMGECDKVIRLTDGWAKYRINGTWYAANDWRVVLKGER